MSVKDTGALFLLAALWGASFLFIRVSSPAIGPVLTMELRVFIAFVVLFVYSLIFRKKLNIKRYWKQFIVIGAVNAALPFTLIAIAAIELNASMTAILNSTTPIFGALMAAIFLRESLTRGKWIGLVLGMVGVTVLMGWSQLPLTTIVILSALCSILAALSYGIAGVYIKKYFSGVDSLSMAVGQQLSASLLLLPFLFFFPVEANWSPTVVISIILLGVFCTAFAFLIYFYLITEVGPTKTLSVTILVPLFGVVWGSVFLQEKITWGTMGGLLIILCSITLITEGRWSSLRRSRVRNSI
ncbi:DMT family transporter [Bacillus sp. 2205SS5-2]|uniref:DMT family transporter n=1 Tax=Bacillus sp. 2205SS5-2 TaxID=3109031 RepID=UPI00300589E0